jgi:hypothetical protein
MPSTYEPIATTTLGTASGTITFSSIPATYTDIKAVFVRATGSNTDLKFRVNGDTGTNFSQTELTANGSAVTSYGRTSQTGVYAGGIEVAPSATQPEFLEIELFSYAGSTNKTFLSKHSADYNGTGEVDIVVSLWRNTAAITSVTIFASSGTFAIGTTATLYGIKNA